MKKVPLSIYLLPFILIILVIVLVRGSDFIIKEPKASKTNVKASEQKSSETTGDNSDVQKTDSAEGFESRIPIYPNAEKAALKPGSEVKEAVFYTTRDPIDNVKKWYITQLGGPQNLIEIDVKRDGIRRITLTLTDPPKELVELREAFEGSPDIIITITTFDFYTRSQPRPIMYEPQADEQEKSAEGTGEKSSENP